jgi:hypothetical protein
VRRLPLLGSSLGLAAVLGGGILLHPELISPPTTPGPAATKAANTSSSRSAADRQTVVSGPNPVRGTTGTGRTPSYTFDSSILGVPVVPKAPSVQLPELQLKPPGPGTGASVTTGTRSTQFGHTSTWTAQQPVNGPVRRVVKTVADNGYVVVPPEPGELHLLCSTSTDSYYVDTHLGEWRVYRVDGGPRYDVRYRFVQYDRSPLGSSTACQ